jgi:hypothetical protein
MEAYNLDLRLPINGKLELCMRKLHPILIILCFAWPSSAFASLFAMQQELKSSLGIPDDKSTNSINFGHAISALYISNLIFGLLNGVFSKIARLKTRIIFGCVFLICSMLCNMIASTMDYKAIPLVGVAYGLGGLGFGLFEPSIVAYVIPWGKKYYDTMMFCFPIGINAVSIGGFYVLSKIPGEVTLRYIYITIIVMLVVTIISICFTESIAHEDNPKSLVKKPMTWLGPVFTKIFALCPQWASLALFAPGSMVYIFDKKTVTLWPDGYVINKHTYFAINAGCLCAGSLIGKYIATRSSEPITPWKFIWIGLPIVYGLNIFVTIHVPLFCWVASFIIFFVNGSIYNHTGKWIEKLLDLKYHTVATSTWVSFGHVGSVISSFFIIQLAVFVKSMK